MTPDVAFAEWSHSLIVEKIFTEDSDMIVAYTSAVDPAKENTVLREGCLPNKWIFTTTSGDRRNRAYSTLMTALVSGKQIKMFVSPSVTNCAAWSFHPTSAVMLFK